MHSPCEADVPKSARVEFEMKAPMPGAAPDSALAKKCVAALRDAVNRRDQIESDIMRDRNSADPWSREFTNISTARR